MPYSRVKSLVFSVILILLMPTHTVRAENSLIPIDNTTFTCLTQMTPVRGFFVDNLLGDLDQTLAVANSPTGGVYPPGSVVQLVPGEVMVKHGEGVSPATRDWEFFELDVDANGSKIAKRGFVDVQNKFGGNCFACHVRAKPEWDLICEQTHGCDPLEISQHMIGLLQKTDPRCDNNPTLSPEDQEALMNLTKAIQSAQTQ